MSVAWPTGMLCHSTLTGRVVWRIPGPRVGRHSCQKVWEELRCRECDEFTAKRLVLLGRSEGKQKKSSDILHENIQDVLVDTSMACKSIGDGSWTCLRKSSGCSLAVDSGRRLVLIGGPANPNLSLPSNDFGRAIRVGHFVRRPKPPSFPSSTLSNFPAHKLAQFCWIQDAFAIRIGI